MNLMPRSTTIRHEKPPIYDACAAKFPIADKTPIFAYAPYIYDPFWTMPSPALIAHEEEHIRRQGEVGGPAIWWQRYLEDEQFRLSEEIIAHLAEYHALTVGKLRNERRQIMATIADRLRHPIYGYQPPLHEHRARSLMKWALHHEGDKAVQQNGPTSL